jgi:hypothetical protein
MGSVPIVKVVFFDDQSRQNNAAVIKNTKNTWHGGTERLNNQRGAPAAGVGALSRVLWGKWRSGF